ncbi:MAG: type II secretion system F family protein [Pseudomonadaceae bacterium]|nr:type II secretion system F family protein [Pseudomonadaceae bacterium]
MPKYAYRAIDANSKPVAGLLVAESETRLERRMQELGLFLVEAKAESVARPRAVKKVPRKELADFFNGLAALLAAGIDVSESLAVMRDESPLEDLKMVLSDLRMNVESGVALDEAMSNHPKVFDPQITNLIRAGSYSGQLVQACADVADHLEWVENIMADIKQATMYPSMIVFAVGALIFLMFSFVVPQFADIFVQLNLELPGITQLVVTIGELATGYWWLAMLIVGSSFALIRFGPKYSAEFALRFDQLKLSLPIFGSLIQMLVLSTFAHNMALMMKAGVPIVEALQLVRGVVGNQVMARAVADAELAVTEGQRMSDAFGRHDVMTPIIMRMLVIGEETGKLDSCLEQVSNRLDNEIPRKIKKVFGILEPAITMTLIGVVGFVAVAIFMPMFSLMSGAMG